MLSQKMQKVVINEVLFADKLVLMSKAMENSKERFWNWKEALKSAGLTVNINNSKVMVSRLKGELLKTRYIHVKLV